MNRPLLDMTGEEIREHMADLGEKPFRAGQLLDWIYAKGVTDPAGMSNVPARVLEGISVLTSHVVERTDTEDGCAKLLLEMRAGARIETVLIPTAQRATVCVSTQCGCAMGCVFCASGAGGLERNLRGYEILEQLIHARQAAERPITHVVFMGMGEPLANYDATVEAIRAIVDPERFGISARRVTVSTVGLAKQILRLAKEDLPITLAISLHAPNDRLREELIPAAKRWPIEEILSAAQAFYQRRHREVTLEYTLIAGVNDSAVCAEALSRIAHRLRCNVNLIRYNPVETSPFEAPSQAAVSAFAERLKRKTVNVQIRHSRGLEGQAACGQLRRRAAAGDGR